MTIQRVGAARDRARTHLESVDLDVVLLESVFAHLVLVLIGEEIHDFGTMITLKLDHLAHVLVLDDGSIASYRKSQHSSLIPHHYGAKAR